MVFRGLTEHYKSSFSCLVGTPASGAMGHGPQRTQITVRTKSDTQGKSFTIIAVLYFLPGPQGTQITARNKSDTQGKSLSSISCQDHRGYVVFGDKHRT
ncbi:hypothetical protein RRG08_045010 [Elysia crispata]|uniref:Uncharacterized protein n=1 Tax=Elysia crispata TaxID=231223 RepID=A0AAE0Y458_9GAST|nr:hypothetical protein RRG08_045010 [Elysia crispata]